MILYFFPNLADTERKCCYLDLVYDVDGSSSVRQNNWDNSILVFLNDTISNMAECKVGPRHLNVGVVKFSTNSAIEFYPKDYLDEASVLSAISNMTWPMGSTNLADSFLTIENDIKYLVNNGFDSANERDDLKHEDVVVVVTDGQPISVTDATTRANALRAKGVRVLIVAVLLPTVSMTDLLQVSNDASVLVCVPFGYI